MSILLNIPTSAKPLYTWNARLFQSAFIQKGTATMQKNFYYSFSNRTSLFSMLIELFFKYT